MRLILNAAFYLPFHTPDINFSILIIYVEKITSFWTSFDSFLPQ